MFKSTNGGGEWDGFNAGLTATNVNALAITSATPATLYAGTEGGGVFAIQQVSWAHLVFLPLILRGQ